MKPLRSAACAIAALTPAVYLTVIRPWHLRWGATAAEARHDLPGDELVRHPGLEITRALTIAAPPSQVWPWLVQMGAGRAGFYSYDRLDNHGVPSAERIISEFQDLAVGDVVPTGPDEGFTVARIEPGRTLVLHDPHASAGPVTAALSWTFALSPISEGTRMLCRMRVAFDPSPAAGVYSPLFELMDFVMMRRHMLGVRRRAERLAAQRHATQAPATASATG